MTTTRRWLSAGLVTAAALLGGARVAAAQTKVQLLVIGNNQPPARGARAASDRSPPPAATTLRFADDDAAAFYALMSEIADSGHLLTVMDRETEARYPGLVAIARPPALVQLRHAVAELAKRMEETRRQGQRNALYIFYSGHGSIVDGREPELALHDGGISYQLLYDEILDKLPADYVHLFVDACHAEAVVRPRESTAQSVPVRAAQGEAFLVQTTLARFPHVGAIVAASSDALAHEWDQLGHGVFSYELLSALRGAADVNRDGRIEYSEIYAFLAAANRGVDDPRGRLSIVARPPAVDRRVPVLELARFSASGEARLRGVPARAGLVEIEDGAGRRVASLRGERDFVADLMIPAGTIFVRAGDREARFEMRPGQVVPFDLLDFHAPSARPRGALAESVRRGLFASAYGPGYYQGFIDQSPEFALVAFSEPAGPAAVPALGLGAQLEYPPPAPRPPQRKYRLLIGAGASNAIADTLGVSETLRIGLRPAASQGPALSLELARAANPGVAEQRLAASLGWVWAARAGQALGWVGGAVGGGAILQTASGTAARASALAVAGPLAGVALDLSARVGLWAEAELAGLAYRRNDRAAFSLGPAAWLGVSLGL